MTRRGVILLLALGIVWGIPYAFIKVAIGEFEPDFLVFARCTIAMLIVLPIALAQRALLPVLKRWRPLLAYTAAEIVVAWYFMNNAEQHLTSSTTGLLLAAVPLVAVGVSFLLRRGVRFRWTNWVGMVVGTVGVVAIVGFDVAGSDLIGVAFLCVTVVGYAFGPAILSGWLSDLPEMGVIAGSLVITTAVYLPFVAITGHWPTEVPSWQAIGSVVLLGVVCTAFAFILFFRLVKEVGPVRTTTITYINPAVAVVTGALLLAEPITPWTIVGFVLVLGGSFLVARRAKPRPGAVAPPPADAPPEPSDPARADAAG